MDEGGNQGGLYPGPKDTGPAGRHSSAPQATAGRPLYFVFASASRIVWVVFSVPDMT